MVNYKKIQRMKERRLHLKKLDNLSSKDVAENKDEFFFFSKAFDDNTQWILLPFVAYNIFSSPEATIFTMYIEDAEKYFVIEGKLSKIFISIKANLREEPICKNVHNLLRAEESNIIEELKKAMKTVCNNLETDNAPEMIWYNQITLVEVDLLDLKSYGDKLDNSIIIIEKKQRISKDNKILTPIIKFPTLYIQNLRLMRKISGLKLTKSFF
ncbi:MAG TPA: hypothetical protein ENI29_22495 [bacterium]|nr:hypothetical protein [bacterium]